jgi:hypothetical protein
MMTSPHLKPGELILQTGKNDLTFVHDCHRMFKHKHINAKDDTKILTPTKSFFFVLI